MADRHCFVCDLPVEGERCPQCGRDGWAGSTQATAGLDPESRTPANDQPKPEPGPLSPPPPPLGEIDEEDEQAPTIGQTLASLMPRRPLGAAAGVLVFAALIFVFLQTPSGLEETEEPLEIEELPPPVASEPIAEVVVAPPPRAPWEPPRSAWVGLTHGSLGEVEVLLGRAMPTTQAIGGLIDVMADGSTLHLGPDGTVFGLDYQRAFNLELPAIQADAVTEGKASLSPNGRRLAVIDQTQRLWIWELTSTSGEPAQLTRSVDVGEDARDLVWSPDSQLVGASRPSGGYLAWDTSGLNLVAEGTDRLLALSSEGIAVWTGDALWAWDGRIELRSLSGDLLRTWHDLIIPSYRSPRAEFDPKERYLALQAQQADVVSPLDGLWVLSVYGSQQERLGPGHPTGQTFTWAGDGSALYYVSERQLSTWPVEATYIASPVEGSRPSFIDLEGSDRLRTYDHALVPSGMLAVLNSEFELSHEPVDQGELVGETPTVVGEDPLVNALELSATTSVRVPCQVVESPGLAAWGPVYVLEPGSIFETSGGYVCVTRGGDTLAAFEGSSLTRLGDHPMFVYGDAVRAITGTTSQTVLEAADLASERILAIAGVRDSLFVLTETGDRGVLYQVPVWSSVLRGPGRVSEFDADPIAVLVLDPPVDSGRLLAAPDGRSLALIVDSEAGPQTHLLSYPIRNRLSPCQLHERSVCETARLPGTAVDFSPDSQWVLIRSNDGSALALSTRGRGSVSLPTVLDGQAAWAGP